MNITNIKEGNIIQFNYTNHRGVNEERNVVYKGLYYGSIPDFYISPRFLLNGFCTNRKALRSFDINKIINFKIISDLTWNVSEEAYVQDKQS